MVRKTYLWKEMPFIRLLPPFLTGIILSQYIRIETGVQILTNLSVLLVLVLFEYLPSSVAWKYRFLRGLLINAFLMGFGSIAVTVHSGSIHQDLIKLQTINAEIKILRLMEPLTDKNTNWTATAEISYMTGNREVFTKCKSIIYFPKDTDTSRLHYGTRLMTMAPLQRILNNGNPGSFDFRRYYADQFVFFRVYIRNQHFTILPAVSANPVFCLVYRIRNRLIDILEKYIPDKTALGLAEALLIGYRNNLDKSLLKVYANTGVVHVIAISGLHLGLIYAIMMFITGKITRKKNRKFLQLLLVIPALWIFSLATGASASVVRSAVMFTILCFGQLFGKKSHSMNALAASAFLLLCYFPSWITDTGFLLSYSAVTGILLYQKRITQICYFSNPLALKFWESISLTLAAQILTTPLVLFYFHRFPMLFLFSNLVAVPLSSLILILELILCIAGLAGFPAEQTGRLIQQLIFFLNDYVLRMDAVPHTVLHTRNISLFQLILQYLFIVFITIAFIFRSKKIAIIGLLPVVLYSACSLISYHHAVKQHQIAVLHFGRTQAIAIIKGRTMKLYTGNSHSGTNSPYYEMLEPVLNHFMIDSVKLSPSIRSNAHLTMTNPSLSVLVLSGRQSFRLPDPDSDSAVTDLVILSGNPEISLTQLAGRIPCQTWVADASNNLWKIQKWKKEAEQLHLRFHSVPEEGAFLLKKD